MVLLPRKYSIFSRELESLFRDVFVLPGSSIRSNPDNPTVMTYSLLYHGLLYAKTDGRCAECSRSIWAAHSGSRPRKQPFFTLQHILPEGVLNWEPTPNDFDASLASHEVATSQLIDLLGSSKSLDDLVEEVRGRNILNVDLPSNLVLLCHHCQPQSADDDKRLQGLLKTPAAFMQELSSRIDKYLSPFPGSTPSSTCSRVSLDDLRSHHSATECSTLFSQVKKLFVATEAFEKKGELKQSIGTITPPLVLKAAFRAGYEFTLARVLEGKIANAAAPVISSQSSGSLRDIVQKPVELALYELRSLVLVENICDSVAYFQNNTDVPIYDDDWHYWTRLLAVAEHVLATAPWDGVRILTASGEVLKHPEMKVLPIPAIRAEISVMLKEIYALPLPSTELNPREFLEETRRTITLSLELLDKHLNVSTIWALIGDLRYAPATLVNRNVDPL